MYAQALLSAVKLQLIQNIQFKRKHSILFYFVFICPIIFANIQHIVPETGAAAEGALAAAFFAAERCSASSSYNKERLKM